MVHHSVRSCSARLGSPRASGGGPRSVTRENFSDSFSPRERGWSAGRRAALGRGRVLPARAGVVRSPPGTSAWTCRSPRASGGGPKGPGFEAETVEFSPRERGWSGARAVADPGVPVLPARAGVVRRSRFRPRNRSSFSPRERGWSARRDPRRLGVAVLPARAGVVRRAGATRVRHECSPRASGGGPTMAPVIHWGPPFSPRERGWSRSFAACPAVDLRSPRASGGGPMRSYFAAASRWFSPRERGWSDGADHYTEVLDVLPARAGVVR